MVCSFSAPTSVGAECVLPLILIALCGKLSLVTSHATLPACNSSVLKFATLAQLVEQCFRKAKVPGSIPGGGSLSKFS